LAEKKQTSGELLLETHGKAIGNWFDMACKTAADTGHDVTFVFTAEINASEKKAECQTTIKEKSEVMKSGKQKLDLSVGPLFEQLEKKPAAEAKKKSPKGKAAAAAATT
jgi:hypothetical protein